VYQWLIETKHLWRKVKIAYDWAMIRNRVFVVLTTVMLLVSIGCETKKAETATQKEMIVYGSDTCDHCISFKAKMDSLGIKYTFYDVQVDQTKAQEMLDKLAKVNFIGNIAFPVVDIEGRVMVSPEIPMVVGLVKK